LNFSPDAATFFAFLGFSLFDSTVVSVFSPDWSSFSAFAASFFALAFSFFF
jgi:hypothetical protein